MAAALALALQASFGSVERWRDEFVALRRANAARAGWILLNFQPREGLLANHRAAGPASLAAGGAPVLAFDTAGAGSNCRQRQVLLVGLKGWRAVGRVLAPKPAAA